MDKTILQEALKRAKPALGNEIIPGLNSFHVLDKTVTAFNGSLLIKSTVEGEDFDFPVTGSIEGDVFYKFISTLNRANDLELQASEEGLVVRSGKSKTVFPVEEIDLAMLEDSQEDNNKLYLPTDMMFAGGIKRCMRSVGGKGIPQEEIGIHTFAEGKECRMYSTNGMTFSRFIFALDEPVGAFHLFLPAAFAEQLLFMYSELATSPKELVVSQKYIRAEFEQVQLRSSFYSSPVKLKLKDQIDTGIDQMFTVKIPKELMETLKRSEVIAGDGVITLDFGDSLLISAKGKKGQSFSETVELAFPDTGSLSVDVKLFRKALEDMTHIGFGDDYVLVKTEDFGHVVMGYET